jgi:hypothetical protein
VVRYDGKPDALVKLPDEWKVDEAKTAQLRAALKADG